MVGLLAGFGCWLGPTPFPRVRLDAALLMGVGTPLLGSWREHLRCRHSAQTSGASSSVHLEISERFARSGFTGGTYPSWICLAVLGV